MTGGRSSLDELVLDWYEDGAGERSDDEDAATACEACGWDCKGKNDDCCFNQRSNLLYCERISILINDKYSIHQRNQ